MLEQYLIYLQNKQIIKPSQRPFFIQWVIDLYKFCKKEPSQDLNQDEINDFIVRLADTRQDWQVHQAEDAIRLYLYYKNQAKKIQAQQKPKTNKIWAKAIDHMVNAMRLKHLSYRTEQTYLSWMRQFYRFVQGRTPQHLDSQHVIYFLTYLAVDRKVAKATQNQAFCSLLFLYRHVLKKEIGELSQAVRAKKKQRLPVVLSQEEVQRLLQQMNSRVELMARLIYGGGLRSNECLRLRVKDLDFDRGCIAQIHLQRRQQIAGIFQVHCCTCAVQQINALGKDFPGLIRLTQEPKGPAQS